MPHLIKLSHLTEMMYRGASFRCGVQHQSIKISVEQSKQSLLQVRLKVRNPRPAADETRTMGQGDIALCVCVCVCVEVASRWHLYSEKAWLAIQLQMLQSSTAFGWVFERLREARIGGHT